MIDSERLYSIIGDMKDELLKLKDRLHDAEELVERVADGYDERSGCIEYVKKNVE